METLTGTAAGAHDFSLMNLFWQADTVVKAVMVLLIGMSLACWTIILEKFVRIAAARREARRFAAAVGAGDGLAEGPAGMSRTVVKAALAAWRDRDEEETRADKRERIERVMRDALGIELRRLEVGLPFLATTASAAPFIGLFGTVWGIINSFSAIAQSQDTSLSVVAPGIAEALFATAIGLVAAIPAVMAYNKLSTDLSRLAQAYRTSIATVSDRLARDRSAVLRNAAE
jgi:biopolymer transport protein TolQ